MRQAVIHQQEPPHEGNQALARPRDTVSHALQVILVAIGLLILSPLFLLVALAVRLTSPGPIFYRGQRVGKGEHIFHIYKFRTLTVGAEKRIGARLLKEDDQLYTPIGKFLKKTKLDELPQLLNVLKGDMSLVGPRPIRPIFLENLKKEIPHYAQRFLVRPGMTGVAQVHGGYWTEPRNKLRYELVYIRNQSVWLDLKVVFLTLLKICNRLVTTGVVLSALFLFVSFFPSSLSPWLYTTIWGVKLNVLHLLIILTGLFLIAKKTYTHRLYLYRSSVYLPMMGFFSIGLISALFSTDFETAARGAIYYVITGFLVTLGFLNTKLSSGFTRHAATLVGLACGALSLLGLFELAIFKHAILPDSLSAVMPTEGTLSSSTWAIRATFANADVLSAYLVLGFPLLLCQLMHARTRAGRDFWLVSTTIAFVSILLTQNLLGLLALFVACAVFLFYISSRAIPLLLCVFLIPILLLGAWDESALFRKVSVSVQQNFTSAMQTLTSEPSYSLFIGSGIKTQQAHLGFNVDSSPDDVVEFSTQNMHLTLIQETGLLGWFSLLWIFAATLRTLYRGARQTIDSYQRSLLWAIFASLIGFLISMNALNTFFFLPLQLLFWGLVGLGLGVTTHIVNKQSPFYVIWRFGDDRPRATQPKMSVSGPLGASPQW
ncbi:MAG: sugar transferase [Candidatus Binatia bacterium]